MKKILVANNHLHTFGGSEVFTYSLALELAERGHEVDVFSFTQGLVSDRIKAFANVLSPKDKFRPYYDLALISHNTCVEKIPYNALYTIQTCHGIYPELEQPSPFADKHVAISEEVKQHLLQKGIKSTIIYNGVDLKRFKPRNPINKQLKTVLSLCQSQVANEKIRQACEQLNVQFNYFNKHQNGVWNVEEEINKADLVVSLGRGVYESMACGRSVLIYDDREYSESFADGLLTKETFPEVLLNNCSGRRFRFKFTVNDLVREMQKYTPEQGEINRALAIRYFDIKKAADQYLKAGKTSLLRKMIFWFTKEENPKSEYEGRFIKGVDDHSIWEVRNGLRHPIHNPEEMESRMMELFGKKDWVYEEIPLSEVIKIPEIMKFNKFRKMDEQ